MIEVATVCTGIGSPEVAIEELGVEHVIKFACDIDKYARASYLANFKPQAMYTDMTAESWIGEKYYSDLFIGGIPCQAFSLAGKRLGELDKRGLLFYDFYRYVENQRPKVFIIENVKGLLSDNGGKTFQNWLLLLGDSVNGHHQMFNHPDSLGYNLHHTVLNAKDFGLPQNRERVFIIGIRPDLPNSFRFPAGFKLTTRLKDILEPIVDEKYYLSDKMVEGLINKVDGSQVGFINQDTQASKVFSIDNTFATLCAGTHGYANGYIEDPVFLNGKDVCNTIRTGGRGSKTAKHSWDIIIEPEPFLKVVGNIEGSNEMRSRIYDEKGLSPCLDTMQGGGKQPKILLNEATKKGFAEDGDSINLSNPDSETRRGRVGVANTLDTACNQAVVTKQRIRKLTPLECWRLQGFPDKNFYLAKEKAIIEPIKGTKGMSDSQLYKQAGNSMASKVMKAIINNLLPILQKP